MPLETLISSLVDNPFYAFAGLVGLCLGIFYGFDGWKGDTVDLSFQDSPRVKNLIWILGPGLAAFIGDVKVLDSTANKPLLLLSYFLPCLVAGFFVVGIWGVVVGASRGIAAWKGKSNGYGFGDALGDYFFYGYRYYRTKSDAARQCQANSRITKIALFLDVDLTLTEETIQQIYASELGVGEEFLRLEQEFQKKTIDSAQFGRQLIELFASKGFTKEKAESFFDKVQLKGWVDKLFTLQDRGVIIYLVSSGPSYYVNALADIKGIPECRTICSTYYFDKQGLISGCDAIEDQQKIDFVLKERQKYDVTIGIGDNDQHDQFVSICTIGMLTTPHSNYFHVPHFNAVFTLIDKLLESAPRASSVQPSKH